jgi:hypothetical protein
LACSDGLAGLAKKIRDTRDSGIFGALHPHFLKVP